MENAEERLARRVRWERQQRGWSYEQLAKAMNDAGVRIGGAACWKIEMQQPRRSVSLDEAMGFARVFGTTLEEMLTPPGLAGHAALLQAQAKYTDLLSAVSEAMRKCNDAADEYRELMNRHFAWAMDQPREINQDLWSLQEETMQEEEARLQEERARLKDEAVRLMEEMRAFALGRIGASHEEEEELKREWQEADRGERQETS